MTKAFELSGRTAICSGWLATEIVPSEASELASRSETVESSRLETMRILPSGVTRAIHGRRPARPRATIAREAQSIATTVFAPDAATKARFPSGEKSSAYGSVPIGMCATI